MMQTRIFHALVLSAALPLLYLADLSPDAQPSLTLVREAHAIVGAPMTPCLLYTSPPGAPAVGTVVNALPAGCKPETKSGVEYQNCGGVFYRSAFQGNNLVYVVQ